MAMRIGLISDTHGDLPEDVYDHLSDCDEIWHAGDIGPLDLYKVLPDGKKIRAVYGNIDGSNNRKQWPENQIFSVGSLKVLMTHIGGYPPRYTKRVLTLLNDLQPNLYICGHSHILKIVGDKSRNLIHMNPGACGHKGFHTFRTMILFEVDNGRITNTRVVELGKRGQAASKA